MLPVREESVFYSDAGQKYTIQILDRDFVAAKGSFETFTPGFTLNYNGNSNDPTNPVNTSACTVNMKVDTVRLALLIDLFKDEQEDRFYINILKDATNYWTGVITQDLITITNESEPFLFKIKATCGLTKLKAIKEDVVGDNNVEKIIYLLKSIGHSDLWLTTEVYLALSDVWYEGQTYTGTPAIDPQAFTRFNNENVVWEEDRDGNILYKSHWEVLNDMLLQKGCRISMVNGIFHVINTNQYSRDTGLFYLYSKNYEVGTDPSSPIVGHLTTGLRDLKLDLATSNIVNLTGSVWEYLPALKSVSRGLNFTNSSLIYQRSFHDMSSLTTIGNIIAASNLSLNLIGNHISSISLSSPGVPKSVNVEIVMTLKVGTYYFSNSAGPSGWGTTAGTYTYPAEVAIISFGLATSVKINLDLNCGKIPSSGVLSVQFEVKVTQISTSTVLTGVVSSELTALQINYLDLTDPGQGEIANFIVENTLLPQSSATLDLGETYLGDYPNNYGKNNLEIYNTSGSWVDSVDWKYNATGTAYNIVELLITEVMRGRLRPIKLFDVKLSGSDFDILKTFVYDGSRYLAIGAQFSAKFDEWKLEAFEVLMNVGNISVSSTGRGTTAANVTLKTNYGGGMNGTTGDVIKVAQVATLTGAGAITTITVSEIPDAVLKSGDPLFIVDIITGEKEEIILNGDVEAEATEITIVSQTLSRQYAPGSYLIYSIYNLLLEIRE